MDKYAVIGFPLGHSFSPQIHNSAFKELGIDAIYNKISIDPASFEDEIKKLKKSDYKGFNITIPFKQKIIPFIDHIDSLAKQANAVNTIHKKNNLWYGYNTDIDGFIRPIKSIIKSISNVLVIGAGGASNAICFSLLQYSGIKSLTILNRTVGKARKIKEILENHYTVEIVSESLNYKNQTQFDLIVNTTSVGMGSSQNETPFDFSDNCHSKTIVYDLIYNPEKTLFLSNAESHGLTFINGLEMLVGQAEKSFKIWTGDNYPEKILTRDIFYKKA